MKKLTRFFVVALFCILLSASSVWAVMLNPNSTVFQDNIHTQLFLPTSGMTSIEVFDLFNGGAGTNFGFFYANNPSNFVVVFDPLDQGSSSIIDFINGIVTDPAHGNRTFTVGTGAIGFFLTLDPLDLDPNLPTLNLYSVAAANPGAYEATSVFPVITDPSLLLIGFDLPGATPLALELVSGVTPLSAPVPEPSTMLLFAAGLPLWAVIRSRGRSKNLNN